MRIQSCSSPLSFFYTIENIPTSYRKHYDTMNTNKISKNTNVVYTRKIRFSAHTTQLQQTTNDARRYPRDVDLVITRIITKLHTNEMTPNHASITFASKTVGVESAELAYPTTIPAYKLLTI